MAELVILYQGSMFTIFALGTDGDHQPVLDFLDGLDGLEPQDAKSFYHLFEVHGDLGPLKNIEKCRHLQDGIYEYKAGRGGRLAWFYDDNRMVICTCGVVKKKDKADPAFIQAALNLRAWYLREKENGTVSIAPDEEA